VLSESSGAVRLAQNRIYGGDLSNPNAPDLGFRVGAWIEGAASVVVENNMIHGGVAEVGFAEGSPSFALALREVDAPIVRHNTLYSGPSGFPTVGTALKTYVDVTGAVIENNILAADGGWNEPIYAEECASTGVFASLRHNLFLDTHDPSNPDGLDQVFGYGGDAQGSCSPWQGFDTVDALAAHLAASGVPASGNFRLRADCGGEGACIPWAGCEATTSLACLQSVFDGWSASDNGLGTLFSDGWRLVPAIPCAVAESALDLSLAADLFGAPRTAPPSIGAHELDGRCTP
jgi:hypothetical protein